MKRIFLLSAIVLSCGSVYGQDKKFMIPYRQKNLWGFCDTLGHVLTAPKYDSTAFTTVHYTAQGLGKIFKNGKVGMINSGGTVLVPPNYDTVSYDLQYDYFLVGESSKFGIIDSTGNLIVPVQYDHVYAFDRGNSFLLTSDRKRGLYHRQTKQLLFPSFDRIVDDPDPVTDEMEKNFLGTKDGKQYLINKHTYVITEYHDKGQTDQSYGVYVPSVEERSGWDEKALDYYSQIVKKNFPADEIIPLEKMTGNRNMRHIFFCIRQKDKVGVVDAMMKKLILPVIYDTISYALTVQNSQYLPQPSILLFAVKKGHSFGIINDRGMEILPFQYDEIRSIEGYTEGFELRKKGRCGVFLPYSGYKTIEPRYKHISYQLSLNDWSFVVFAIQKKGKTGYVGENGVEYFHF